MKHNLIKTAFLLSLFILTLHSCSNDDNHIDSVQTENLTDKQKLMQETSLLLGKMLTNVEVKKVLNQTMKEVDKDADMVSFAYLFDQENSLKNNEVAKFRKKAKQSKVQNLFKRTLKQEFEENIEDYKTLQKTIRLKNSFDNKIKQAKLSNSVADELAALLVSEELQVFYPYEDTNVEDYYVSFDPLNESKTNFGYKFEGGSTDVEVVNGLDNNFLDNNPVYLIVPIDPCDIPGRPCDFIELKPVDEESTNKLAATTNLSVGKHRLDYKTNKVANGFPPPVATLLTYNVNHNNIPETDIISSYIPQIRINGTDWMGFAGTDQKLRIFRGSADGKVTQNADGSITAAPTSYQISDYKCDRKYLKRKLSWLQLNAEFDLDWNMSENTQGMAVFSIHHLKAAATAEFEVKSGFKLEKGVPVPFAEASDTRKLKISTGSAIFRANAEMSRRQILATIVGPGPIGSTVADNGVQYNVKKIGIIEYYFKHVYTDL